LLLLVKVAAVNATGFLGPGTYRGSRGLLAAYLSAHKIMIIGSAICAALAVTERN